MRASALLPLVSLITLVHCAPLAPESVATDAYHANHDAIKSSNGNVYASPWIPPPADFDVSPLGVCIIATGQAPNSVFKSPDGQEHKADAFGRVLRNDCVPAQADGEPIFRPDLGSVQAAQPGDDGDSSFPPSGDDSNNDGDDENGPFDDDFPIDDEEGPYPEDNDNAPQPSFTFNIPTPSASNAADEPTSPTDTTTTPAPSPNQDDDNYYDDFFPFDNGRVAAAAPTDDAPEAFSGSLPLPSVTAGVPPFGLPQPGSPSLGKPNKTFPRPGVAAEIKASMNGCADGCKEC